jgi:hypothetical protein
MDHAALDTQHSALLPLDSPQRIVSWRDRQRNRDRRHIFRPPERRVVRQFYREMNPSLDAEGRISPEAHLLAAHLNLYSACIVCAQGYVVETGDLMALPDWQRRIPEGDRRLAAAFLGHVVPSRGDTDNLPDLEAEHDVVILDALWNESEPGKMQWHTGLIHRFAPMTAEDELELRNQLTRSYAVGGSRAGRTIQPVRELVLLRFYDRKIRSVEGYSLHGEPIAAVEEIVQFMDPFHKIAAMDRLLAPIPPAEIPPQPGTTPAADQEDEDY